LGDKPVFSVRPSFRFSLNQDFINSYKGQQPKWGPAGYVTYKRTYSRSLNGHGSEEFYQTLQRVVDGSFSVLKQQVLRFNQEWDDGEAQSKAQEMFRRMWEFKFLPPGRGLWFMGTEALEKKGAAALNNCGFVSTEFLDRDFAGPFCVLMDYLMLGVGMGFDTRGAGKVVLAAPRRSGDSFVIEDSREGWIEGVRTCLGAFTGRTALPSVWDVSPCRPAGAPLKTFGGYSSGPGPLLQLLEAIEFILSEEIGQKISSSAIVDLMNVIGRCVVSGNIRRSSEIAIGFPGDEPFLHLKDPERNPAALKSHRWASNNTVLCELGQDYRQIVKETAKNGEPGFAWPEIYRNYGRLVDPPNQKDDKAKGFNPCGEQTLWDNELCCLVETFPTNHENLEDWISTLKYAYLYAKIVTLIPTHRPATNATISRNRRMGVSMAGIASMYDNLGIKQCAQWWDAGYEYLKAIDRDHSGWMGVPESIKITSVKPGGTIPLLAGVEGGMKFPVASYFYRTIRFEETSPLLTWIAGRGIQVERDEVAPRTMVAYFPVASQGGRSSLEIGLWEQGMLLAALQRYWSDNMVSATLTFNRDEAKDLKNFIEAFEGQLKCVSLLPQSNHGYAQAPYIPISADVYLEETERIKPFGAADGIAHDQEDRFCDGGACSIAPAVA
jgi:ribonucleoside-triphosphate reductase